MESFDPIGKALELLPRYIGDHTEDHPLTPELFWSRLKLDGFSVHGTNPEREEHGSFFAHLVLDHAFSQGLVGGNIAQHHYWARRPGVADLGMFGT